MGERWTGVYKLSVENKNQFQKYWSKNDSLVPLSRIRSFYGEKDTIELMRVNSENLKRAMEMNFGVFVENEMDKNMVFSVKIPNGKINETANYLEENYGIGLKRNRAKREFLIVK